MKKRIAATYLWIFTLALGLTLLGCEILPDPDQDITDLLEQGFTEEHADPSIIHSCVGRCCMNMLEEK